MLNNLVSVIIPCYNSSRYLRICVESVLAQTYQNLEIIIVDDCSTDNTTHQLLKALALQDNRIKVIYLNKNSGPAIARNKAIEQAKGRYIAFCDSDDMWMPKKIEAQLPLFKDKQVAVVYANYEKINARGERNNRIVCAPKQTNYQQLLKSNVIGNLTGVYDTQKVGKVFYQNIKHEDYALWLSILRKGWMAHNANQVLAAYRVHALSLTANKLKVSLWQWRIYRKQEHLSIIASIYYYVQYAIRAFIKSRI